MHIRSTIFFIASVVLVCSVSPNLARASETDGTVIAGGNAGYAWSNNAGWVNFGLAGGNVHVTDAGLTGHAWSANTGWINLAPANGGVTNNDGVLGGNAWGAGLGWINFFGVTIDSAGRFRGSASGTLIGTLTFNCDHCDVRTDWRPSSARSAVSSATTGGGRGGGISTPAILPLPTSPSELTPAQAKALDPVKDGAFNILDFNAMMVNWEKQEPGNPADINRDGVVDVFDFNLLMVYWGVTYQI